MTIEEKIFKRTIIDFNQLPKFGFTKSGDVWTYSELFMNGDFKAMVSITQQGSMFGTVFETATEDEFLPLRVENMEGFAGEVRAEYQKILENIKANCCRINYFAHPQANRLTQAIYDTFGDEPTFPWDKFDGYGVFKNPDSKKWYALIMTIDRSKLDKKLSGEIEVVNIKLDEAKIPELHKQNGFYPAYHMNKKSWITITLDDTVPDDVLFALVNESHAFTLGKHKRRQA
ncbi:MAG: MmcQ/YjbR family DNA-binding protein [Alphaproteobacteria bacterium]|nr:MmcQ/YjbR family DNA-binding protein [Alphaproteobacteria bacterium]